MLLLFSLLETCETENRFVLGGFKTTAKNAKTFNKMSLQSIPDVQLFLVIVSSYISKLETYIDRVVTST